jgi:hypothetical protein
LLPGKIRLSKHRGNRQVPSIWFLRGR